MSNVSSNQKSSDREVLEFDFGVRVYPPARDGGYWRVRWEERHRGRDTSARDRAAAITKASEIVERLARSAPTALARSRGADLVAHYLDPSRRPPRVNVIVRGGEPASPAESAGGAQWTVVALADDAWLVTVVAASAAAVRRTLDAASAHGRVASAGSRSSS